MQKVPGNLIYFVVFFSLNNKPTVYYLWCLSEYYHFLRGWSQSFLSVPVNGVGTDAACTLPTLAYNGNQSTIEPVTLLGQRIRYSDGSRDIPAINECDCVKWAEPSGVPQASRYADDWINCNALEQYKGLNVRCCSDGGVERTCQLGMMYNTAQCGYS